MDTLQIGLMYGGATLAALFSGMPIAFALGGVAVLFMMLFMPGASLDTVAQNVYEELASITLLTIPLFILKGAAIGKSRAGKDLYDALHTWLNRVPGGLGVAVVLACGLFAAMAGSSACNLQRDRQLRHSGDAATGLFTGFCGWDWWRRVARWAFCCRRASCSSCMRWRRSSRWAGYFWLGLALGCCCW